MQNLFKLMLLIFIAQVIGCTTLSDVVLVDESGQPKLDKISDEFEGGERVESKVVKQYGKMFYVERMGYTNITKDCILQRTELSLTEDGSYMLRVNGKGETCTGDGCSLCAFKDSGGCVCKKFSGTCNHTISRNRVFLRR